MSKSKATYELPFEEMARRAQEPIREDLPFRLSTLTSEKYLPQIRLLVDVMTAASAAKHVPASISNITHTLGEGFLCLKHPSR